MNVLSILVTGAGSTGDLVAIFLGLLALVLFFVLLFVALLIALRVVEADNTEYNEVAVTNILVFLVTVILGYFLGFLGLIIAFFVDLYLISSRHTDSYLKAFAVIILWLVFFVILLIVTSIFIALPIALVR